MTIDKDIEGLFEIVQKRKSELVEAKAAVSAPWKTNCNFQIGKEAINIQTANEESLLDIVSHLIQARSSRTEAALLLGIKAPEKFGSSTANDWISDCVKRITKIQLTEKERKFNELEARLTAIVSPEQRRVMELEEIKKSLQ